MPNEFIQNNLESIIKSIEIIYQRFHGIKRADDFMTTPTAVTKLDSISMRLQVIGYSI
jgi:hypothetical protein